MMCMITWLWQVIECLEYTLSDDKTIFTAKGNLEPLTQACVRDSKLYSLYQQAIISEGITEIEDSAFVSCSALISVSIAETVQEIGNFVFEGCSSLQSAVFPTGVAKIGNSIFKYCSSLKSVTFSSTMTSLGSSPFIYTTGLSRIEVNYNSLFKTDEEGKFLIYNKTVLAGCVTNQAKLIVPACIEVIPRNSFEELSFITSIEFEKNSNLTTVESSSFTGSPCKAVCFPFGTRWLGSLLFERSIIETVVLPSSLEYVSSNVFDRATSLTNVTIIGNCPVLPSENGVIYSKDKVSCLFIPPNIEEITISENTTSIATSSLQTKKYLVKVNISKNNKDYFEFNNTLYNKDSLTLFAVLGGVKYIEVHENCTSVGYLSVAYSNVEKIVFLGTKVTTFAQNAFSVASKLQSLELPYGLKYINIWCLDYVPNLTKLVFPSTFLTISANAITESGITEVDFSLCSEMKYLDSKSFQSSRISSIQMPPNLLEIQSKSFSSTHSLINISIPSSVTRIHSRAFENSALQSITFGESSHLTYLADSCFAGTNLENFTFPSNVEEVGESIFNQCSKLKNISFEPNDRLTVLNPRMFSGCKISEIFLNCQNLSTIKECAFTGCNELKSITICTENDYFFSINGCLYSKGYFEFVACPCGAEEVTVDGNTTSIVSSAFFECKHLKKVSFGEDSMIEYIGRSTFVGCILLKSIEIPPKILTIEAECFKGCDSLTKVIFLTGNILNQIGSSCFLQCSNIIDIDLSPCSELKSLNESAFSGCTQLAKVIIGRSVESIGSKCFANCANLKSVYVCADKIEGPPDIFAECPSNLEIYSSISFNQSTLGGLYVIRSLDRDCMFASLRFTLLKKDETSKFVGFILSVSGDQSSSE